MNQILEVDVSPSRFPFEATRDVIGALVQVRPADIQVSGVALVRPAPSRRRLRPRFLSVRELRRALDAGGVRFVAPGLSQRERERLTVRALQGALVLGPFPGLPRFSERGAPHV